MKQSELKPLSISYTRNKVEVLVSTLVSLDTLSQPLKCKRMEIYLVNLETLLRVQTSLTSTSLPLKRPSTNALRRVLKLATQLSACGTFLLMDKCIPSILVRWLSKSQQDTLSVKLLKTLNQLFWSLSWPSK